MPLKVVFITGSHLSSNPRLVKEASALKNEGYTVEIVCVQNLKYLRDFDLEVSKQLKGVKIHTIDYSNQKITGTYLRSISALRVKLKKALAKFIPLPKRWRWLEINRIYPEMRSVLKRIKADLYIAHTPAALPLAAQAAEFHSSKFAFDAEDFHRGEGNDSGYHKNMKLMEDTYLPYAKYISTASPFSTNEYSKLYPKQKVITINNVFSYKGYYEKKQQTNEPLKLVWFSQTIGLNRGIQEFINVLNQIKPENFELHLRGTCDEDTKNTLLDYTDKSRQKSIFFYPQCSPDSLEKWLQNFDVGLALEHTEDLNKELCISNKIFQYITAGLGIIATNTKGQEWVLNQMPEVGFIIEHANISRTLSLLNNWIDKPADLILAKQASNNAAKKLFNWDIEKMKFLDLVSSTN